jgi:flagellar basal body-associated protein FliL
MIDAESENSAVEIEQAEQPGWSKSLLIRWIVAIVLGSIVVDCALFFLLRKSLQPPAPVPVELEVGSFDFVAAREATTDIEPLSQPAKFDIHVRFIDDLERPGRELLTAHRHRVRESIENLLRKSQQVELSDPAMARLKHEIQQRIDDALDIRAVAEVIITNLRIDSANRTAAAATISDGPACAAKISIEPTAVLQSN